MKRKFFILALSVLILTGCSNNPSIYVVTQTPIQTTDIETFESNNSTMAISENPVKSSAEILSQLTLEIEAFIFREGNLATYDAVDTYYSPAFGWKINQEDLDGDGSLDEVELSEGTKVYSEMGYDFYSDVTVSINGKALSLKSDYKDYYFWDEYGAIEGTIVDIDKDDGRQEILITVWKLYKTESGDYNSDEYGYLIKYDHGTPELIGSLRVPDEKYAVTNGTGYIVWYNLLDTGVSVYALKEINAERSGFIDVPMTQYRTIFYGVTHFSITKFDVALANEPGDTEAIELPEGSTAIVGLYDIRDYIELHTEHGVTLGWLNLKGRTLTYLDELYGCDLARL